MILVDYNAIAIGTVMVLDDPMNEYMLRHQILNSLRMYNKKHRDRFGKMVVCGDGRSWRREIFPQYKFKRREGRDGDNKIDWGKVFGTIAKVSDEITEHLPWTYIRHGRAEADDIIAILCEQTQEFGQHEEVMIISGDKDLVQLQKWNNIHQYSPITKKLLKLDEDAERHIFFHVCRGDKGDGVPNILSHDDCFVNGDRQNQLRTTAINKYFNERDRLQESMGSEVYRNFVRNRKLIDLDHCPADIKGQVLDMYNSMPATPKGKILNYLIKNKLKRLIECAGDFQ